MAYSVSTHPAATRSQGTTARALPLAVPAAATPAVAPEISRAALSTAVTIAAREARESFMPT